METKIQIPGYKIQRELGHGGMAHVYLAIQESFGREVALKILSPHLADDDQFSKRFLREARIVSQLNHPNIITVFDAGKYQKYHYMSMEYIPGKDVKQLKDSISREEALRIVKDVASALDFAGKKGIVHRDVKPENIMIHQSDKRVVLMDFGIAHGDDVTHGMTQTGKAIGTPHFMSPEQTKGLKVDHRSDIYSLGVVLYQLLAGNLPFDADSAVAVGIKHLTSPIPLLPGGLEIFQPIINRCLSKDPKHRYQKAAELITALDNITDEQLKSISSQAKIFKKAGADHDAKTQMSDAVISQPRKIPDIVFPSNNKTAVNDKLSDTDANLKTGSSRRRNLLILLLFSTLLWAGYEKQKELIHFWGYKAVPKIAKTFPDLLPKSYVQFWAEKLKPEIKPAELNPALTIATSDSAISNQAIAANNAATNVSQTADAGAKVNNELSAEEKLSQLKEGLKDNPDNAIKLAAIYKGMLLESKDDPVAREGIKELREWFVQQIRLAFATEDAALARKHIEQMKQNFPRAAQNKRFIRLERKVAALETIQAHLDQAEKYFKAGALSKPIGRNALDEVQKVFTLSPNNEDAKTFIDKIVNSYLDKTTQLQEQGNIHNALLMLEEGIAALNNNPALVEKRKELKDRIKSNKNIAALFKQATKYQASGQLIKPRAYNAYDLYQEIIKQDKDNLQAKAGLKSIHQKVAKDIISKIQQGKLDDSKEYLQLAIQRYGKSSLLANVQLKLNDALDARAPKIETINISHAPLTQVETTLSSSNNTEILQLNKTVYVGFEFLNFAPATTWLDATLTDTKTGTKVAQKPIVISSQFGEHFFEINLPIKGFRKSTYKLELKLKNRVLKSKSFTVRI